MQRTYYENGVKAQLAYYMNLAFCAKLVCHNMKIDQTYIDGYFTGEAAYATGGTKEDRLHQIWTQRWLIDFFQGNGLNYPQHFSVQDIRCFRWIRLPVMNPDDKTKYPQRWKYDTSENLTNPVNYKKAVDEQYGGYDGINKIPWYLQ